MINHKLLITDDEPNNLALLGEILRDDYELSFASNGRETLELLTRIHPALILLDVGLPGMDGYEVCRRIKQNPATEDIPVIFVTAHSDTESEELGFSAGCVDYLTKPVSPSIVKARVRAHLSLVRASDLEQSRREAIYMLGQAGEYNDTDTGAHIWRMAAYSRTLAERMGWGMDHAELLELASPMHDIGKIGIPDAILQKPAGLDSGEWEIMRSHCRIGYNILSKSNASLFQFAAEIALRHHEKWDGTGYPDGLSGTAIPESARIVAVADVFDALSMPRPYKQPWPLDQIVATIRAEAGAHFDPSVVTAFDACLPQLLEIRTGWENLQREQQPSYRRLTVGKIRSS